jgi:hypothetical protein
VSQLDVTGVQMACLSYLEPGNFTNARYLVRRLRRKLPQARILAGFWTLTGHEAEERNALTATRADLVVTSLREAVDQVVRAAKDAANDLKPEIRVVAGAPRATTSNDTVVEFPTPFDQPGRREPVHEEANSGAGRADHLS